MGFSSPWIKMAKETLTDIFFWIAMLGIFHYLKNFIFKLNLTLYTFIKSTEKKNMQTLKCIIYSLFSVEIQIHKIQVFEHNREQAWGPALASLASLGYVASWMDQKRKMNGIK